MNRKTQWRIRLKWTIRKLRSKLPHWKLRRQKEQTGTASETPLNAIGTTKRNLSGNHAMNRNHPDAEKAEITRQRRWELTRLILRILPNLLILLPKLWIQIRRLIQSWNASGEN